MNPSFRSVVLAFDFKKTESYFYEAFQFLVLQKEEEKARVFKRGNLCFSTLMMDLRV